MEPTSLSDNIAYLIGDVEHRVYQQISRIFRENKVVATIEQFTVLSILWYDDGLKQQEIAERLNRDKTTVTRAINNMVKKNMVEMMIKGDSLGDAGEFADTEYVVTLYIKLTKNGYNLIKRKWSLVAYPEATEETIYSSYRYSDK